MTKEKISCFPYKEFQGNQILFSFSELPSIESKLCCPDCYTPLTIKSNCFYWRKTKQKHFSGLACKKCNGFWENPEDSWSIQIAGVTFEKVHTMNEQEAKAT